MRGHFLHPGVQAKLQQTYCRHSGTRQLSFNGCHLSCCDGECEQYHMNKELNLVVTVLAMIDCMIACKPHGPEVHAISSYSS